GEAFGEQLVDPRGVGAAREKGVALVGGALLQLREQRQRGGGEDDPRRDHGPARAATRHETGDSPWHPRREYRIAKRVRPGCRRKRAAHRLTASRRPLSTRRAGGFWTQDEEAGTRTDRAARGAGARRVRRRRRQRGCPGT